MSLRVRARAWPLVVALAAHAAALVALSRATLAPPPCAPSASEEAIVELVPLAPDDAPRSSAAPPAEAAVAVSSAADTRRDAPGRLTRSVPRVEAPAASAESPDAPKAAPAAPGAAPALPLTARELGIARGADNPFMPRSEAAVELAESKRAVGRALTDPARERERELGLGPEGPVLTALGEATSQSTAPVRGSATFVATADENGVVSLELQESEGGRAGWDDARRIALAALRGKKLRLPRGATRAVMRLAVRSDWKLPGGQDPGTNVRVFRIPVAKGETESSTAVSVLDPIPKLRVTEVPISKDVKLPVVTIELDLFSTNADPANLGARPRRVVHARAIETQVM